MKYIALLFTALFMLNCSSNAQKQNKSKGYKIGSSASDFSLMNVDGNMVSLKDYDDAKGFVICFTCNHCPFSIANESRLISIDERYKEKGFPVIAINPNDPAVNEDDSYDKMIERSAERGFTFPYLFDEGQEIFPVYGATKTPHIYLLQKVGEEFIVKYIGAIDNSTRDEEEVTEHYLEDALNALIKNQEIELKETKAIGCSIKVQKK